MISFISLNRFDISKVNLGRCQRLLFVFGWKRGEQLSICTYILHALSKSNRSSSSIFLNDGWEIFNEFNLILWKVKIAAKKDVILKSHSFSLTFSFFLSAENIRKLYPRNFIRMRDFMTAVYCWYGEYLRLYEETCLVTFHIYFW